MMQATFKFVITALGYYKFKSNFASTQNELGTTSVYKFNKRLSNDLPKTLIT